MIRIGNPFKHNTIVGDVVTGLQSTTPLRRKHLYASDAACYRKSVMMLHAPDDMVDISTAPSTLYKVIGSAIHTAIAQALERTGRLIGAEVRFYDKSLNLSGVIDLVIRTGDGPMLVEVKTCGALPSRPKEWHYEQALTYSLATGVPVMLLYVSRNVASYDGRLLVQPITLNPTHSDYTLMAQRLILARLYGELGKLGPIPEHIRSEHQCGWCPFKAICWGSEPAFIPYATPSEQAAVNTRTAEEADKLIAGMGGRRVRFLEYLELLEQRNSSTGCDECDDSGYLLLGSDETD